MAAAEAAAEAAELSAPPLEVPEAKFLYRRAPGNQRRGGARLHSWAGGRSHGMREDAEAFASRRNHRELVAAGQGQLAHGGYKTSGGTARSRSALISRQVFVWRAWWRARRRLLHAEATARQESGELAQGGSIADAFASRRGGRETRGGTAASLCRGWRCIEGSFGAAVGRARNRRRENAAVGRDSGEVVDERRRVWWR
ncbi:hypothetical protein B0H13DRAFT_1893130 [Mycena leptocephala]|nr:hypothetical protein B0H13DRAFT_1893130 [Mycena leptocephala]